MYTAILNFFKVVLYNPLYNILIFFVWLIPGHSAGWAIIILTIIIRLLLLPASLKASRAQVKLQALQPEMNRIKAEIKDQQAQGKALMDLYKREGVSPFGSCLPLLIQLPILIILYRVFRIGLDTKSFSLLYSFVPRPTSINAFFLGFNLAKPDLWILPILAAVTQFFLSKLTMPPLPKTELKTESGEPLPPDPMQMMNKQMIYLFPIVTLIIARSIPAALALYWIITTVFGIIQQIYVNKTIQKTPKFQAEIAADEKATEKEIAELKSKEIPAPTSKPETSKKPDLMTKMMNKRLDRQEKKTGVEITIRKKN